MKTINISYTFLISYEFSIPKLISKYITELLNVYLHRSRRHIS